LDLNGDGKEALLVYTDDTVKVLGADLEAKWTWPIPIDKQAHVPVKADLVDILPAEGGNPATVVVWAGKSVFGLSAATGRPRWRGEMLDVPSPNSRNDRPDPHPERVLLRDRTGLGLPRLLADESCRLTWPVDEQGRYQPPSGKPTTYPPLADPNLPRPLPWVRSKSDTSGVPLSVRMVPWSLLWLVASIVYTYLPSALLLFALIAALVLTLVSLRRRKWIRFGISFLTWAVLTVAWTMLLRSGEMSGAFFVPTSETIVYALLVPVGGLPFVATTVSTVLWVRRRQWRRLGLFVVASVALAAWFAKLQLDTDRPRMAADEQYTLDRWYLIFVYGVYLAGCLLLLGWLGKLAYRLARQRAARL
jgi:hypothetical protein